MLMPVPDMPPVLHPSDRRRRAWLSALVLAWGAQAIVTQSLLLREAIVLMFGSEFAWGIVLFAWLLGVAVGASCGGWAAERLKRAEVGLVAALLALSVSACVGIWVFRGTRAWLGVAPGELLPLPETALAAMLFVSPAGALVGMSFPFACCVARVAVPRTPVCRSTGSADAVGPSRGLLQFGHVYALESAGSLIGGALFSFWVVDHVTPVQTALMFGAVTMACSAGLLATLRRRSIAAAGLAVTALAALAISVFAGEALNRRLIERRWRDIAPGYELVAETESKYQSLAVGRRAGQFTLYSDGQVSTDFPDPYTFVPQAHFWLCQHPSPRAVLVLGGGAEGLLAEILRHPVAHVDYVEPDPRQLELITPFLAEADRRALADRRVTVQHVDARYYVKTQRDRFDLVIARLPEPTSAQRARFYTAEFYAELRRSMTSRAVLCLTAAAAPGELSATSREYLASLRATVRRHFSHVVIGWGDPAQVLAATETGLISTDPAELAARYASRGVRSKLFHPAWFDGAADWLDADKLSRRAADLDAAGDVPISTDLRPVAYVQRLVLWEQARGGGIGSAHGGVRVIERVRSVGLAEVVVGLTLLAVITLVVCRLRRSGRSGWAGGAVVLSVGTTGFATMALSIVWLFAFQNLYGYVYQRIGWIIALFMGGLVIGCALASRRARHAAESEGHAAYLWRGLIVIDLLLALLASVVPFFLPILGGLPGGRFAFVLVEWCISIMVVLTGLLGGAAFPLAGCLQQGSTSRVGAAAGSVVGADHAGACLGALLCGILLVPVFGTATAAFLMAGMKLGSAALLWTGWRLSRAVA